MTGIIPACILRRRIGTRR